MVPEIYNKDPDDVVACKAPWRKNEYGMGCSHCFRECPYAVTRREQEEQEHR